MLLKNNRPFALTQPYNRKLFMRDVVSGLTLFVMLVPQGMAYALVAGVTPVMGLYASTIPLLVYAVFASSRHLSVGPTAITSLLVFSGVSMYGQPGTPEVVSQVILLALMVGTFQLLFGVFQLGFVVKFISPAVLGGYTSAAAFVIAISQWKHLLGIPTGTHLQVHLLLMDTVSELKELHWLTFFIGVGSILALIILKKLDHRIPAALLVILLSIFFVYFFALETKGVQIVGTIPGGLPAVTFPEISLAALRTLFVPALTIAMLGFMESLAIGRTIADKENYKILPNQELKALGLANIFGSFFQSFPINGSFSRSAVNHQSGGVSQVASVITGVSIIVTLLLFTSYFYYLPNAVLAAIIVVAVYKLIDFRQISRLVKGKAPDKWSWLLTFVVTLFIGIQWGILIGAIFSLLLLLSKSSKPDIVEVGYVEEEKVFRNLERFPHAKTLEGTKILRIDSSLYFANVIYLEEKLADLFPEKFEFNRLIIDFSGVNNMDASSLKVLEAFMNEQDRQGKKVFMVGMKGPVRDVVHHAGWDKKYPEQIRFSTIEQLLKEKGKNSLE
ncbi:sulfate permease, SulP family [Evansella caseinilytica]|uniref:Sulfate permease, SulP family n=1 Tax=Evansella caseinilytica TaxID=1503961 RepID=A0A1H3UTF8_9BACI|nr:sulfate permease [Evansella caseinilytica]SDZ65740.1 sulfate permease, SulP family [Evansella caseinilytica]